MSSTVFVVDSSFKRTQVKVTPGKYLREILEDACKSRKLDPESYTLKNQNNKVLDLSQPFRLSGLSAGAKLQLTQASRSPSVVSIALQLPESEGGLRLSDKFPSTTSLWLVLRKYEDGVAGSSKKLNLTQRGAPSGTSGTGRLLYEQPCLNLMGRSLESFADLQKTLAQLGLNSGNAMIRLTFKLTQQPLEEAMQEISQYFTAVDSSADGTSLARAAAPEGSIKSSPTVENVAELQPQTNAKITGSDGDITMIGTRSTTHLESEGIRSGAGSRSQSQTEQETRVETPAPLNGISVFQAPSNSTPAAALQPEDPTVFEPTVDHAKAHQAALQRASKNTRLLSDKELEEQAREKQEKLASVQSVVVRVRYPDQLMIELTIYASDSAADLYHKVMDTLAAAPEPFELRFQSEKGQQLLPNNPNARLVRDLGWRGRVLVNFAWSPDASLKARQGPSLKDEYRTRATELKVDLASQQAQGQADHRAAMNKRPAEEKKGAGSKMDVEAKLKKFMGFGKK